MVYSQGEFINERFESKKIERLVNAIGDVSVKLIGASVNFCKLSSGC